MGRLFGKNAVKAMGALAIGVFAILVVACSNSSTGDKLICLRGTCKSGDLIAEPTKKPEPPKPAPILPHSAETVMTKLRSDCLACHGIGKDKRSYWPMPPEFDLPTEAELKAKNENPADKPTFEKMLKNSDSLEKLISKIESDQFSVEVYQSIENNILGLYDSAPKAMPYMVKFDKAQAEDYKRVLAWFQSRLPFVVSDARSKYHVKSNGVGAPVDFSYKCTSLVSGRQFLNRIAQDALGRSVRDYEVDEFEKLAAAGKTLDDAVSPEMRKKAVEKLGTEWRQEFIGYGLKKFAEKLSSSGKIMGSNIIVDTALRNDIAGEFYELLKQMVQQGKSYKEILSSNKVYATKNSAPYYGADCKKRVNDPKNSKLKYVECEMEAPRGTFFTTLGFLASKPSAMFFENNNYGRVAAMNEVIRGETLLPNTAGEKGDAVRPLPECLVTNDWRVLVQGPTSHAPRGTASVPASGNFCQGCHINRQLAAGSIVFRPFGPIGEKLVAGDFTGANPLVNRDFSQTTEQEQLLISYILTAGSKLKEGKVIPENNNWANKLPNSKELQPIDNETFAKWLNIGTAQGQERGCVQEDGKNTSMTTVKDLLDYYTRDEKVYARGLSRIIPRALSNLNATNQEIINLVMESWTEGQGQLLPVIQSYFSSETFACSSTGEKK
ncbi:MAG: hypothetical protein EBR09_04035 [Proteobacteria bacterium]|nr:hypothetical protein [Pseudomonadota bacterium]